MRGLVNAYEGKENKVVVLMREKSVFDPNAGCDVPVIELSIIPKAGTHDVEIAKDIVDLIIAIKVYGRRSEKWYILIEDDDHIEGNAHLDLSLMLLGFRKSNINNQRSFAI